MKELYEIMMEFAHVQNGLCEHPHTFHMADIMNSIFQPVGDRVYDCFYSIDDAKPLSKEELEAFYESMETFMNDFDIGELGTPLEHLKEYINSISTDK